MIKHETGDATSPKPVGDRGVIIAHMCNSLGLWGAGFVKALSKMSMVPEYAYLGLAHDHGLNIGKRKGDSGTLAQIPLGEILLVEALSNVWVANMVAQSGTNSFDDRGNKRPQKVNVDGGPNECLVDYPALEKCLVKVFDKAALLNCDVHMPNLMGSGLAGGDKTKIHDIIETLYHGETDEDADWDDVFNVALWEFTDTSAASFVPPPAMPSRSSSSLRMHERFQAQHGRSKMKTLFKGIMFNVVGFPGPSGREYQAVEHPGAVAILPIREEHKDGPIEVLLIRQMRYPVGEELWEVPAGTLDVPGETTEECALRELLEETGYKSQKISKVGDIYTSPGYSTELIHLYVAQDLSQIQGPEEGVVSEWVRLSQMPERIRDGRIKDSKTIVMLNLMRDPLIEL